MDLPHHFTADPHGTFAGARAARDKLAQLDEDAERQKALPDLQAQRAAILAEKQTVASAIGAYGPEGNREANPERQALHDTLRDLNNQLDDLNRQIAAIPPVMAPDDRAAHVADLQRRVAS